MKILYLIQLSLICCFQITAQTPLTKVNGIDEEALLIAPATYGSNFSFATSFEHILYDYNQVSGVVNFTTLKTDTGGFNDIGFSQSATGDTLAIEIASGGLYVSISNVDGSSTVFYNGTSVITSRIPVVSFAKDESGNVYFFYEHELGSSSRLIYGCNNGVLFPLNFNSSIPTSSQQLIDTYTSITYVKQGSTPYLAILNSDFHMYSNLAFIDISDNTLDDTDFSVGINNTTVKTITSYNSEIHLVFENENNKIQKFADLVQPLNPIDVFSVPVGISINEIAANSDFIFAATTNGVYTNNQVLSVDEVSTFDGVNIYPNPFTNQITITNLLLDSEFEIIDIHGKVIQKGNSIDGGICNVSIEADNGIYFFKVIGSNNVIQLIKQ